jgi:hypothetical protein
MNIVLGSPRVFQLAKAETVHTHEETLLLLSQRVENRLGEVRALPRLHTWLYYSRAGHLGFPQCWGVQ